MIHVTSRHVTPQARGGVGRVGGGGSTGARRESHTVICARAADRRSVEAVASDRKVAQPHDSTLSLSLPYTKIKKHLQKCHVSSITQKINLRVFAQFWGPMQTSTNIFKFLGPGAMPLGGPWL